MKNFTFLSLLALTSTGFVHAQESMPPILLEDTYLQKISHAGTYVAGQDGMGSVTIGYNTQTGDTDWYPACYPGDGNCVSNNGYIVGQEMQMDGMYAALMKDGQTIVTAPLKVGGMSQFNAITPDGSRACGYISNTSSSGALFVPFYCDITPDGQILDPVLLPCPTRDLFGSRPQYILGGCISDDGKRIVGLVTDGSGGYTWPIIFTEDADGNWSYSQPTESLFNPNNLELPADPDEAVNPIREPLPEDYMTPEEKAAYRNMRTQYPGFSDYWEYMSDESYHQYLADHIQWADDYANWYYESFDEYQRVMRQMGSDQHFGGILLISPDGSYMITAKNGVPYRFNLEDDTFGPLGINTGGIMLTQILADGTLLGCSVVGYSPYNGYICLAGTEEFVKMTDYLADRRPLDYEWLETTALNSGPELVTGIPLFSEDMQTICGGYYDGAGGALSYVFRTGTNNGVESLQLPEDGSLDVYTLQGLKLRDVKNTEDLRTLPKGIYIVNGKKIAL